MSNTLSMMPGWFESAERQAQGAGDPKPEQGRGRTEAGAADDGDGGDLEKLRHESRYNSPGEFLGASSRTK